ncbi:MAG: polysaccharide biosynthesis C-terminal domain-containing protein [Clostridiales bacterium]|nr:polysaccharide biosynthesis C-terminal domain-containing protein [Clostridiales bacterium]
MESRSTRTLKNSAAGFLNKMINILMPFLTRTAIIYILGMEYAGLNSLFSSVLQVLNLAELGISSAVVYCMYKPMADNDTSTLCALLRYMRKLYFIIGAVVIAIGVAIIPIVPYFISGAVPDALNISLLYGIYLINTGIGYFFYAYKSTLLNAGQKVGIISNINSGIILLQSIAQILVLYLLKNYYLYLAMMPIFTVFNNIWISYAVKKTYPDIVCRGELEGKIKSDISIHVKGLFVTKVCTTTRNAFDSIFISSFIGLTTVAIYGNYYYIMSAITAILSVITTAMTASVGNSIVTESVEKNYNDLRKFNFLFNWVVGYFTCCLLTMYQPFMSLWMGESALFPYEMVILLCVYFYFLNLGSIRAVYHDAAGLWWEARYRAIFEAILNLALNLLLTRTLGVFGTVLGTLISLVIINYGYGTQIVFKYYFKGISSKEYFIDNGKYNLVTVVACLATVAILNFIHTSSLVELFVALVVSSIVFNGIYFLFFFKTGLFANCKLIVVQCIKRFIHTG